MLLSFMSMSMANFCSFSFWCNHFDVQVLTVSQSKSSQLQIVQIAIYLHQSICPTWVAMYLALFMIWHSAKTIILWKKDSVSKQIRSFPIDLTALLKNFFRKNFLVNFLRRRPWNFLSFLKKILFYRMLDLGKLGHFQSIRPPFWRHFWKKYFLYGPI